MHKAVILLMKAEDREDALSKTNEFMEGHKDDVWDWWRIGGRWTNHLAPKEQYEEWEKEYEKIVNYKKGDFGVSTTELKAHKEIIQKAWEDAGLKGKNPVYYNGGFNFDLPDEGGVYDIVPLKDAIDVVKSWSFDIMEKHNEEMAKAKEWLEGSGENMFEKLKKEKPDTWFEETKSTRERMYGYCLKRAADIIRQEFSFETNVFNTEKNNFSIPEDYDGWYAVMVDMHN